MSQHILVLGLNYAHTPIETLERAAAVIEDPARAACELAESSAIAEVVVLRTCNRIELYLAADEFHPALEEGARFLARAAECSRAELASLCYVYRDVEAVQHSMRLSAGLDSLVIGEEQIIAQLRQAYALARESGCVGTVLHELMQHAMHTGKRVRSATQLDRAGHSVASRALEEAAQYLPQRPITVVLVGAGVMASLSCAWVREHLDAKLYIANRDVQRAEILAERYHAQALSLGQLDEYLPTADLLLTAAATSEPFVSSEFLAGADELTICDLGMPRNVAPEVEKQGVRVVSIATLTGQRGVEEGDELAQAETIITRECEAFTVRMRTHAVGPIIAALRQHASEVVTEELEQLHRRTPTLTGQQRAEIERSVHRIVQSLLHEPTIRAKELSAHDGSLNYSDLLATLFNLDISHTSVESALELGAERMSSSHNTEAKGEKV